MRDFADVRLQRMGLDLQTTGESPRCVLRAIPTVRDELDTGDVRGMLRDLAARWNACADALVAAQTYLPGDLDESFPLDRAIQVLRKAIYGE
jgi:hypothetical protein